MKTFYAILLAGLIMSLLCNSCKKDENDNSDSRFSGNTLNGKIQNWVPGGTLMLKPYVDSEAGSEYLGSFTIGSDGSFSITLPTPPDIPGVYLPVTDFGGPHITISNQNAKLAFVYLEVHNDEGFPVYYLEQSNSLSDETKGYMSVEYLYVTNDCNLTGYYEDEYEHSEINLELRKGWNAMVMELVNKTLVNGDDYYEYKYYCELPGSLVWKFHEY